LKKFIIEISLDIADERPLLLEMCLFSIDFIDHE
jgi:hypothetical protein